VNTQPNRAQRAITGAQLYTKLTNLVDNAVYRLTWDDETNPHDVLERLLDRLIDIADNLQESMVDTDEPEVWYDVCQGCGGVFPLAPSRSPLCATCVDMETDFRAEEEFEPRRLRVVKDLSNSPSAAAIGLPWIAYCPCCPWFAPFTGHQYALHEALNHVTRQHYTHPDTGQEVPW
jgi:hypothetical protein